MLDDVSKTLSEIRIVISTGSISSEEARLAWKDHLRGGVSVSCCKTAGSLSLTKTNFVRTCVLHSDLRLRKLKLQF
jgi:hypothetical protein